MTSTMEFDCKLAHNDERRKLSSFNSIKDLYARISQTFAVPSSEILYCTLNTHNFRDMDHMLGNYLCYGDLIVVHLCGTVKELTIKKTQEFLGLTITDNANGRAFVKRVKSDDEQIVANIKPGDHVAAINSDSTLGMRHYEVAKVIRLLPQHVNFKMRLIEPRHSIKYFDPSTVDCADNNLSSELESNSIRGKSTSHLRHELSRSMSLSSTCDELINSSLPIDKLLSRGTSTNCDGLSRSNEVDGYKRKIEQINSILDSFLGINDNLLAIRIYRLARENENSYDQFLDAIKQSELNMFNFDDEMKDYLWKCARDIPVQ